MDQLLNVLEDEIRIRESRQLSEKPSMKHFKEDRKKRPLSTATALVGSQMRTPTKLDKRCPYCLGSHAAEFCEKVTSTDDRRKILRKYMRCFSGLNKGHKAKDCRAKRPGTKCQGEHHQSICQPKEEEVTVSTLHAQMKGGIALQTLQAFVKAKNGMKLICCRLLLDTGRQYTFITKELEDLLQAKPSRTAKVSLCGIGKSEGIATTGTVYEVSIIGLDKKHSVSTQAYTLPTISKINNFKPQVQQQRHQHLKSLWFPDVSEKEELEVHMLIGIEDYYKLQMGNVRQEESQNAPRAVETIFGWTLAGEITKEPEYRSLVTVNLATEKYTKESDLKRLWDLETLGIREADDVYEGFKDNIRFNGYRYSVRLPWKAGSYHLPDNKAMCEQRLRCLLRRLRKELDVLYEYDRIMKEQLEQGIME